MAATGAKPTVALPKPEPESSRSLSEDAVRYAATDKQEADVGGNTTVQNNAVICYWVTW